MLVSVCISVSLWMFLGWGGSVCMLRTCLYSRYVLSCECSVTSIALTGLRECGPRFTSFPVYLTDYYFSS